MIALDKRGVINYYRDMENNKLNTPKDCKCGAKYVTGLRSSENGQMVDQDNQFTCFRCYNEENAARLRMEDAA